MLLKVKHIDDEVYKCVRIECMNKHHIVDQDICCANFLEEIDAIAGYKVNKIHHTDYSGDWIELTRSDIVSNSGEIYRHHFRDMMDMGGNCKVIIQHSNQNVDVIPDYFGDPVTAADFPLKMGPFVEYIIDDGNNNNSLNNESKTNPLNNESKTNPLNNESLDKLDITIQKGEEVTYIYINGKLNDHPDGTPAETHANGAVKHYKDGVLHKEDGYAVVNPDGDNQHWLRGEYFPSLYRKNVRLFIDNLDELTEEDKKVLDEREDHGQYLNNLVKNGDESDIKKLLKYDGSKCISKESINIALESSLLVENPSIDIFRLLLKFGNSDPIDQTSHHFYDYIISMNLIEHLKEMILWTDRNGMGVDPSDCVGIFGVVFSKDRRDMFDLLCDEVDRPSVLLNDGSVLVEALKTKNPYYVEKLLDLYSETDLKPEKYLPLLVILSQQSNNELEEQGIHRIVGMLLKRMSPEYVTGQSYYYLQTSYVSKTKLYDTVHSLMEWRGPKGEFIDLRKLNVKNENRDVVELLLNWKGPNGECYDVFEDHQHINQKFPDLLKDKLVFQIGSDTFRLRKKLRVHEDYGDINNNDENSVLLWCDKI